MKNNRYSSLDRTRVSRIEPLENRELLSATPLDATAADSELFSSETALSCVPISLDGLDAEIAAATTETPSTVVGSLDDSINPADGVVTLREAIEVYSHDGDTITFKNSLEGKTISLGSEITISKSITIDASSIYNDIDGAPGLTLDANGTNRHFNISSSSGQEVTIVGLSLINGAVNDGSGGSILVEDASLTISKSLLYGNVAFSGGAILLQNGSLTVENSEFSNNDSYAGAAVYNNNGSVVYRDSVFHHNYANDSYNGSNYGYGGALVVVGDSGTASIENSDLYANLGQTSGGAVYVSGGYVRVFNSRIYGNLARDDKGAGICVVDGSLEIQGTLFQGNDATFGGAVSLEGAYAQISNSVFYHNPAVSGGGAFYAESSGLNVTNSLIYANSVVSGPGGALYAVDASADFKNALVHNNSATTGGAFYATNSSGVYATNVTVVNNLSEENSGAIQLQNSSALLFNSIVVDNGDADDIVLIGESDILGRNSLSSFTNWTEDPEDGESGDVNYVYNPALPLFKDAINGDYSLADGSQAINLGDPSYCEALSYDLAGQYRTMDGLPDLGAYEYSGLLGAFIDYDPSSRTGVLSWNSLYEELGSDVKYTIKLSKDGGATWTTYRKNLSLTTTTVSGLYTGKDYLFRIYGVTDTGSLTSDYQEVFFAPFNLSCSMESYSVGDTISVNLSGSNSAAPDIRWYFMTPTGDFEIDEAHGLVQYAPTSADYDVKVVVKGVSASLGCCQEVIVKAEESNIYVSDYTLSSRVGTLNWKTVAGADSYTVRISKDGGETWINYKKGVTDASLQVSGLYAGKDYGLRVYSVSRGVTSSSYQETFFAPVSVKVSSPTYSAGDTITVALTAADRDSVLVSWYNVTNVGDVEIAAARNSLTYTPDVASHNIRVVATGTGDSLGSSDETTVVAMRGVDFDYDAETRKAVLTWNPIVGAESYKIKITRNNGETWLGYASDLTTTSSTVSGLYAGKSYGFRIYGVAPDGKTLRTYREAFIAPIALKGSAETYSAGNKLTVTLTAADNAAADIRWYKITDSGAVEIVSARNSLNYTPTSANYDIKVVATGTNDSEGSTSEVAFTALGGGVETDDVTFDYDAATRKVALNWNPIPGAVTYKLQLSKNDGQTWPNYKSGLTTSSATVSGIYVGQSYGFRVYGVASNGTVLSNYYEAFLTPANAPAPQENVTFVYDAAARKVTLNWAPIAGAATYKLQVSKNDGATWPNYKTGLATTAADVSGIYAGKSYGFRVYGVASNGTVLSNYYESFFTPTSSSLLDEAFADFFEDAPFVEI
ncbi:MAG: fibronectin type III domain-containing protein [Thermoguttaceae bacterium]|nr:fibronectin type III domain-containing protein [Thermoguttaceae bacterium]